MEDVSDPPTAAQVSQILERLNNLVEDVREVKAKQDKANTLLVEIATVQTNLSNVDGRVRQLTRVLDLRTDEIFRNNTRIALLERWRMALVALAMVSMGAIGWAFTRIEYVSQLEVQVAQLNTRLSTMELLANGHAIEKSLEPHQQNLKEKR